MTDLEKKDIITKIKDSGLVLAKPVLDITAEVQESPAATTPKKGIISGFNLEEFLVPYAHKKIRVIIEEVKEI